MCRSQQDKGEQDKGEQIKGEHNKGDYMATAIAMKSEKYSGMYNTNN